MSAHRFETVVRLPHTDAAGVVFFARYFDLVHLAFEDFLEALGHPLEPDLFAATVGFPLVHAEADYQRPLRMGDRIAIDVSVASVRPRSFVLSYAVTCDAAPVATAQTVHAALDVRTTSRVDLPEDLRSALSARLPR